MGSTGALDDVVVEIEVQLAGSLDELLLPEILRARLCDGGVRQVASRLPAGSNDDAPLHPTMRDLTPLSLHEGERIVERDPDHRTRAASRGRSRIMR